MNVKKITTHHLFTLLIVAVVSAVTVSFINFNIENTSVVVISQPTKSTSNSAEVSTTQYVLGYESKHGGLPDSLRGTTIENALLVDAEGLPNYLYRY